MRTPLQRHGLEDVPVTTRSLGVPARLVLGALLLGGVIVSAPTGFGVLWFVPFATVGTLLAVRRPSTSIGWILIGIGWSLAIATLTIDATPEQFAAGSVEPLTAGLAVITSMAGASGFLLIATLAIVFPSGRLPAGRWHRVTSVALAAGVGALALSAVMPSISVNVWGEPASIPVRNPASVLPDLPIWQLVTPETVILPLVALLIAAAISLVDRYRRAAGVERQQLRWLAASLTFVVLAVLGGFLLGSVVPEAAASGVVWLGAVVAFPCVPVAVGFAVLRYRLYEIDRIISRTIGWALLTAILAAVFAATIVGLQAVLAPLTQNNTLAVAASTLVAAALFQPLRGRVQRTVDRRFNRPRVEADQAAASFAIRVRNEVDLGALRAALVGTAGDAVHPEAAALWLRTVPVRGRQAAP